MAKRFVENNVMRAISIICLLSVCISLSAQQQECKCCTEEFRQFDFWIGSWEVFDSTDALLGRNVIAVIQDSCVLRENWTSARSPYTGTSYNFYDPASETWSQTWIDNQGGSLQLKGGLVESTMQLLSSPSKDGQGRMVVNRITWTPLPDGTVRQQWDTKADEGAWTTLFDGIYKRAD